MKRGLEPLRSGNFALFLGGFVVSNSGRWAELTGAVWLVSELSDSALILGGIGIARAVPGIALTPFAGVIVDRVDQRRLLILTQAATVAVSLAMAALVLSGLVEIWHIYVQVAAQSVIGAFDASVRQAMFPSMVPRSQLPAAVTLYSTSARLSQLAGPTIGGLVIAGLGVAAPFWVNGLSSVVLIGALGRMTPTPGRGTDGSSFRHELAEGYRHITGSPLLAGILRLEIVVGLVSVNPVLITVVGREILHVGPDGLGILLSAGALGALGAVALIILLGPPERIGRAIVLSQLGYAVLLLGLIGASTYAVAFAILLAIGFLDAVASVSRQNVMQLASPARIRGRVMANVGTITRGTGPLSQTVSGSLIAAVGPAAALAASAAVLASVASVAGRFNQTLWKSRRSSLERRNSHDDERPSPFLDPDPAP